MNYSRLLSTLAIVLIAFPTMCVAQFQQIYPAQRIASPPQVYAPGTMMPGQASHAYNPACQCNPNTPGDCKCKNLDCKVRLPHGCKRVTPRYKTPINCEIYGSIPKLIETRCCMKKIKDFEALTDVPQICCVSETCIEIGKKLLQCLPGCCFDVCIPTFQCKSDIIECKMVQKAMPMELWERIDHGQTVYDVFVVNNRDPNSNFHAGGMPAKWVVMHCGTKAHVQSRFPGLLAKAGKGAKPQSTPADVEISLVVDEKKMNDYFRSENEKAAKENAKASAPANKKAKTKNRIGQTKANSNSKTG